MSEFRIVHIAHIVVKYDAANEKEALAKASIDADQYTIADLVGGACDLFILEPRIDDTPA